MGADDDVTWLQFHNKTLVFPHLFAGKFCSALESLVQ
jgi:hypothetical protein